MPVKHARPWLIVAVGENRRSHHDFFAHDAPNGMTARINLRGHILNHDSLAAIAWLHGNRLLRSGMHEAKSKHAGP